LCGSCTPRRSSTSGYLKVMQCKLKIDRKNYCFRISHNRLNVTLVFNQPKATEQLSPRLIQFRSFEEPTKSVKCAV
jgi:hypothetical protein